MHEVDISSSPPDRFDPLVDASSRDRFRDALERGIGALGGGTLWHVNSTGRGGGVAEMLRSLLGYVAGAGIATRWVVLDADRAFFDVTKGLHHLLHGSPPPGGELGDRERDRYERTLGDNAGDLDDAVGFGDVVVLHDPQTVGLAPIIRRTGARVIWTCHIGVDEPNARARSAWEFLGPYVRSTQAQVFSRSTYVWEGLDAESVAIIPPCIDAFSAKNADLDEASVGAILQAAGVVADGEGSSVQTERTARHGAPLRIERRAEMTEEAPLTTSSRIVAQVSRWDPLKDPVGVLSGFAEHVPDRVDAHLLLAGPAVDAVDDDPEAGTTFSEVLEAWHALPASSRRRTHLASLPMEDLDENAAIVNAIQRRSDVIVQKSLAEGFGLTVAEAMWKGRPVVGGRVGGIQDQVVDGQTGLLVDDPRDLPAFGRAVTHLLEHPEEAGAMGRRGRERVTAEYLPPRYLADSLELVARVVDAE